MKRLVLILTIPLLFVLFSAGGLRAQSQTIFSLDLEGGLAFSGSNSIQGAGAGDTRFNTWAELHQHAKPYYRIRPTLTLGRHAFSALFAPTYLRYTGTLGSGTGFGGSSYGDRSVNLDYRLTSYRLTYRYNIFNSERFIAGLGVTAKFRNAVVKVSDGSVTTEKSSFGFQPLLNVYINGWVTDHVGIIVEGDAFGLSNWRTEDVFVGLGYRPFQNLTFKGGYRIMEGGSSLTDLYNFSLVNYVGLGVILSL